MTAGTWSRGRLLVRWVLVRVLPDDDWSAEFVAELDYAVTRRGERKQGPGLTLWYLGQVLSPATLRFIRAVRLRNKQRWGGSVNSFQSRRVLLSGLGTDLRQTWRGLTRDAWVSLLIVVTLALGIGSVTAMYGLAKRLFLSGPLHVAEPEHIVRMFLAFEDAGGGRTSPWIPYRTARAIQENASLFSGFTLYRHSEELVDFGARVRPTLVTAVGGSYFDVLGVVPATGRFFRGDPIPDPSSAVLSHAKAVSEFGTADAALGRVLRVGDRSLSVVGVAPAGFAGPGLDRIDVWVPLNTGTATTRNWYVAGRVSPGATPAAAAAEAQSIHEATDPGRSFRWAREGTMRAAGVDADLGGERSVETSIAGLLMAVVGLMLMIAWINVLNLLLARVTRRSGEVTIRLALGIGRWRLVRLLLAESLSLSLAGGLLSLPVAYAEGLLVRQVLLPSVAWGGATLEFELLAVTLLVVLISGGILGLLPARRASRTEIVRGLSSARQGTSRGATRLQSALATSQITFSAALLLCAGLFQKSFWTIRVTDLGIDAEGIRVVTLRSLAEERGTRDERTATALRIENVYLQALDQMRARRDGTRAAVSVGLPFYSNFGQSVHVDGLDSIPELPGGGPFITMVSDGYFATVGTRILRGEGITAGHVDVGERVAVVGATTARVLWPRSDALGHCLRIGTASDPCFRVVGIAGDVHRQGYREPPSLQVYVPLGSTDNFRGSTLLVRPGRGAGAYESQLTAELSRLDPLIDYVDVRRLDSYLDSQIRPWRLGAVMLGMVGALAVAMSVAGVFGVLTYVVAQRRREIGVRMALGATDHSIRTLVLRMGLISGIIGVTIGFTGVLAASRWLGPLLFETRVADPMVMVGVGLGLLTVALGACLLPARQAARVDPAACLRAEA